ncbi:MAG TPA: glycosyltransferase family 1 protein [Planctomycetaceae bacterium]|nr:glycosyltransferase family 1 protein [Planctomycetaceae bacterium]
MKIAYVIINANRHEGTARAVWEVAERFAQEHEVHLWARTAKTISNSRVIWKRVPGPKRPEVADFVSFRWFVDRRLLNDQYDIIHSAGPNTNVANVYTIQTVHPFKMANLNPMRAEATASPLRRMCWRFYDTRVVAAERSAYTARGPSGRRCFLPVSAGTRRELLDAYPATACDDEASNVCVVGNGADLVTFSPGNRDRFRDPVRTELGFNGDDFILMFSGGDWRRKGLDLLFDALTKIDDARVKLLVVGNDRAERDLQSRPAELGMEGRVRFAGFRTDVEKFYAASDLFVFPTSYEAFSLATIEAAASGLPVLMSDVSGADELVGDGTCGAIIRRDPEHIAQMILAFRRDPIRMRAASLAARARVEQQFNWDRIASQTLDVYRSITGDRQSSP